MVPYKSLPELQQLADQIGEFVYYWGFKRIHGRIWTHLFLSKESLDAADLVRRLDISKALVSISLRELLDFEVIQVAGKSPRGTQLYRTNPDILSVILAVLRQRERRMLSHIQSAHEGLTKVPSTDLNDDGMSGEQLERLGQLIGKARFNLDSFLALKQVDFGDWQNLFQGENEQIRTMEFKSDFEQAGGAAAALPQAPESSLP